MRAAHKLWLAMLGALLFLGVLVSAVVALLVFADKPEDAQSNLVAVVLITLAAGGVAASVLRELYSLYLRAPLRMAEEVDVLRGNSAVRLGEYGAFELRVLGRAINALAAARQALENDVAARVHAAQVTLEEERSRLAALMADLDQSVIVCNRDGRILLYNQRARLDLGAGGGVADTFAGGLLGLGRSIYTLFDRAMIAHALERLEQKRREGRALAALPAAQFVTVTRAGRLLHAHMSPVLSHEEMNGAEPASSAGSVITGFVLILDDITTAHEIDARRDTLIQTLVEGGRGPLGNIRAAAETLTDFADMAPEQRERFLGVIRDEARVLSQHIESAAHAYSDDLRERWPLQEMLGAELMLAAIQRIEAHGLIAAKTEEVEEDLCLRIDSFALLQALDFLAGRLHDEYGIREVRLALSRAGRLAQLDLIWSGTAMNNETAMTWELDSMKTGGQATTLSVRDVVDRCNGEIWFQRQRASHRACFRMLLPATEAPVDGARPSLPTREGSRPEFYDFDLFRWSAASRELQDRSLAELVYTVFDTETTGLEPSAGDEIIQIGATRIVNRRLLRDECLDQLIDPRRRLSPESIRVHGITPDLLLDQPTFDVVLPVFHEFCADTVLVAHNAAFDMRFLQLKEAAIGLRFDQPVLDTFLLSAVLHPNQETHRLEAIAERLGVSVIGRHTALGDAIVTGEVFLKMIPLLDAMGIHTLRQAREASERTYHARLQY